MKYWKKGFFEEPQDETVEITEEYYNELLNGQSNGLLIVENEDHYPILKSNDPVTLDEFQKIKIEEINAYDRSDAVNECIIRGLPMWMSKERRIGLKNRFESERVNGLTETTLWLETMKITLSIDVAIEMLMQIEIYAGKCYDVTQQHIVNVKEFTKIEDVVNYDFTIHYPPKLTFAI